MANMSYCRMENTYMDLKDCYDEWENVSSESEERYRKKILELARDIIENCDEEYDLISREEE